MKTLVAIAAVGSCLAGAASMAASPPAVPQGLLACSKLSDSAARLRCYDAQMGTLQHAPAASAGHAGQPAAAPAAPAVPRSTAREESAPAAPASSAASAAPAAAATESGSSVPGTPAANAPVAAPAAPAPASAAQTAAAAQARATAQFGSESLPPSERPQQPKRQMVLSSTIREKVQVGPNVYLLALANGQVWRMTGSPVLYFFHVGDPIRIERRPFGAYHLWDTAAGAKNWVRVRRIR